MIPLRTFDHLKAQQDLLHFQSTRMGGISTGVWASLNVGFHTGDLAQNVLENRRLLARTLGTDPETFVFGSQIHGTGVTIVTQAHRGSGALSAETALPGTDGLITNLPGICLTILTADCVPVLLYDPEKRVIAAVHAGWKGTVGRIASKTVSAMVEVFGCQPAQMLAGIGPSAGPCCYEVGDEVMNAVKQYGEISQTNPHLLTKGGKTHYDLWEANRTQLIETGLMAEKIEVMGICTCCHTEEFYSHRSEHGLIGRMAAGIMMGFGVPCQPSG